MQSRYVATAKWARTAFSWNEVAGCRAVETQGCSFSFYSAMLKFLLQQVNCSLSFCSRPEGMSGPHRRLCRTLLPGANCLQRPQSSVNLEETLGVNQTYISCLKIVK